MDLKTLLKLVEINKLSDIEKALREKKEKDPEKWDKELYIEIEEEEGFLGL